jgi:PAS domain S-box-containing protein
MNEELRSTMEELETSKEELQSMNEELQTVNQENRHKVEELAQLSSDLQNLLSATDIATLFLDRELRILRFTPKVADLFNVRMTDRGRPLSDLTHRLGYSDLHKDAAQVLKRLTPIEREVRDEEERWYLTRILPYRSADDRIEGVVITFVDISERKRAEDAVRAGAERLQRMINVDAVGVMTLTDEGRLIGSNDAFLKMMDYSREDVESGRLHWRDITPSEFIQTTERQMKQLAETGRVGPYEKELIRKDGSRIWMVIAGASLGDGTFIKYCIDILDRKRIESALRESQQQLTEELRAMERLHELVGDLVGSRDLEAALRFVLKSSMEITGADKGNIQLLNTATGKLEIAAQEGLEGPFLDYFKDVDETGSSACGQALCTRKRVIIEDVEEDPAFAPHRKVAAEAGIRSVQSTPLISRTGELLGVLSTHHGHPFAFSNRHARLLDLHVRQATDFIDGLRGRQLLRESEQRYRMLVESAREYAIVMLDTQGKIETWNTGAQRIFGYSAEEITGRHGSVLFTEEDREAGVPQAEMETAASAGTASDDRWQVRKDGSRFYASGVMEALRSDGAVHSFAKVLRDNTEKKQMEEAQARLNQRLEELVAERTSEVRVREEEVRELASRLTVAEHEERHRIAQILHDDLQQLLYSVQLKLAMAREPLAAGQLETGLRSLTEAEKWIGEAVRTAQRLSVDLSPQVLQNEGLAEALHWLGAQLEELHGLQVEVKVQQEVQLPKANRVIVFQAVRELLFNVVKHAQVKEATVELGGDDGVVARVTDRGKGFDVNELKTHAGFGIMSVKHRLDLLGGDMEINSTPGKGTSVTIRANAGSKRLD